MPANPPTRDEFAKLVEAAQEAFALFIRKLEVGDIDDCPVYEEAKERSSESRTAVLSAYSALLARVEMLERERNEARASLVGQGDSDGRRIFQLEAELAEARKALSARPEPGDAEPKVEQMLASGWTCPITFSVTHGSETVITLGREGFGQYRVTLSAALSPQTEERKAFFTSRYLRKDDGALSDIGMRELRHRAIERLSKYNTTNGPAVLMEAEALTIARISRIITERAMSAPSPEGDQ